MTPCDTGKPPSARRCAPRRGMTCSHERHAASCLHIRRLHDSATVHRVTTNRRGPSLRYSMKTFLLLAALTAPFAAMAVDLIDPDLPVPGIAETAHWGL